MKSHAKDVKDQTKEFLANRKKANNLLDILAYFESEDDAVVLVCVRSLHRIFTTLLTDKAMYFDRPPADEADIKGLTSEEQVRYWLRERYNDTQTRLIALLTHHSSSIQETSLCTLMKLVEAESKSPLRQIAAKHITFPTSFHQQIVGGLLSESTPLKQLIARFQEYLAFDDVRYFTMKHMLAYLTARGDGLGEVCLDNVFAVLTALSMPNVKVNKADASDALGKLLAPPPAAEGNPKMTSLKEHQKLFSTLWLRFLSLKLAPSLYKRCLLVLADHVMPHMSSPLLLADFLTTSYDIGGAISLLALNGLFVLVNAFNLDYPDFFKKLYALFEPSVFHVKYRARFFFLADLFLTSTHLPAYLVAAFIKRLSRLALTAPPASLSLVLPFIYNLINRHPNCKALVHRSTPPEGIMDDPYLTEEPDPAKCQALHSSLWELKTLQDHYHHSVATEARKINNPLNPLEIDLADLLELTTHEMFQREVKKKMKTMPMTFQEPQGLFNKDDQFPDLWLLE